MNSLQFLIHKVPINADPVIGKYGNDPKYGMYNPETIVQRAESKLGRNSFYYIQLHNCHNFTNWCRTGVDYNSYPLAGESKGICTYGDEIITYKTWDNI